MWDIIEIKIENFKFKIFNQEINLDIITGIICFINIPINLFFLHVFVFFNFYIALNSENILFYIRLLSQEYDKSFSDNKLFKKFK